MKEILVKENEKVDKAAKKTHYTRTWKIPYGDLQPTINKTLKDK